MGSDNWLGEFAERSQELPVTSWLPVESRVLKGISTRLLDAWEAAGRRGNCAIGFFFLFFFAVLMYFLILKRRSLDVQASAPSETGCQRIGY